MLTDGDIARLVQRIRDGYRCLAIGIFGSYAIGTASDRSDLDLLVIAHSPHPPGRRERDVHRLLIGLLHPLDVVVFTPAEFEAGAYDEHAFTWTLARQAQLLWCAPQAAVAVPSLAPLVARLRTESDAAAP